MVGTPTLGAALEEEPNKPPLKTLMKENTNEAKKMKKEK